MDFALEMARRFRLDQHKKYRRLSFGMRTMVTTLLSLAGGGDVILLDEPSNDLDIETLRALEDAILVFPGTVMVVSHDRWFLDRIATHILSFENETPEFFTGNYTEFEEYRRKRDGDDLATRRQKYRKIGA